MKTNLIYFSPTGGTKEVINLLGESFEEIREIDLSIVNYNYHSEVFEQDDLCFIAVPAYGGRVPSVALERLSFMKGNGAKTILLVSYGNRAYEDTFLELKEVSKKNGFHVCGAIAAICEHSIMHQYATNRPDQKDREQLKLFSYKIKDYLNGDVKEVEVPGYYPYREYHGIPLKPLVNSKCSRCNLCAMKCPVAAISLEHPEITNSEVCISCMRCIDVCPNQARYLDESMLKGLSEKLKKVCESRKENELFLGD